MKIYFVLGLMRSGNHAFIQSIIENYNVVTFYNNYGGGRLAPESGRSFSRDIYTKISRLSERTEVVIVSAEDKSLTEFNTLIDKVLTDIGYTFDEQYKVVVCRDLLNLCASRQKMPVNKHIIDVWQELVLATDPYIIFNYNKYLTSEEYRCELAQKLNLKHLSLQQTVPQYGQGSTFAIKSMKPQRIDQYLTRYKDRPIPSCIEPEQLALSEKIFEIQYQPPAPTPALALTEVPKQP